MKGGFKEMRNIFATVLLLFAAFLILAGLAAAGKDASPISTSEETRGERLIEASGPVKLAPRVSAPIPTVAPSPEYRRLPAWDFLPARARIKK